MYRRASIDWSAVNLAAPRRVIAARELRKLGVPSRTIANRAGRDGPWSRILPGVLMLTTGVRTWQQRLDAALRYAGDGALITGNAGARLHGLGRLPHSDAVQLLIPDRRQRASHSWVVIERTIRLPTPVLNNGLPLAPLERCIIDSARRMTELDPIRGLIAEAVQRGYTSVPALRTELETGCDRGSALPRLILNEVSDGVRSVAEGWARKLVLASDLPRPQWNVDLYDDTGEFIVSPDAWFDEVGMAWEIDSYEFHLSPRDYARTLERRTAMSTRGIEVLHTLPMRLRDEPGKVVDELTAMYAVARQRPRPRVVARNRPEFPIPMWHERDVGAV